MNPHQVTVAVSQPNFYFRKKEFWKMLSFLFADYQSQKVHTFLPSNTFRNICAQLYALIEAEYDYAVLESNQMLLYHTYFVILKNIRAHKTITRMTVDETPETMMALYQLYKRLLELKPGPLPLFAHLLGTVDE